MEKSLEEVFVRASSIKSIVISGPDMEEIESLIDGVEAEMDVNPMEFMEPSRLEYMNSFWEGLDKTCKSCMQKLKKWQKN